MVRHQLPLPWVGRRPRIRADPGPGVLRARVRQDRGAQALVARDCVRLARPLPGRPVAHRQPRLPKLGREHHGGRFARAAARVPAHGAARRGEWRDRGVAAARPRVEGVGREVPRRARPVLAQAPPRVVHRAVAPLPGPGAWRLRAEHPGRAVRGGIWSGDAVPRLGDACLQGGGDGRPRAVGRGHDGAGDGGDGARRVRWLPQVARRASQRSRGGGARGRRRGSGSGGCRSVFRGGRQVAGAAQVGGAGADRFHHAHRGCGGVGFGR
mmetsp:Transcript_32701/g.105688  ORF Transcript_32701/g.105688 Transcript_32701/m.105688 type:complete len:268 (-) Transcript_32701:557-1360(-)